MNQERRMCLPHPYVMLLLAPVLWSTSNVCAKFSVGLISANQFTFYRWLAATLLLSVGAYQYIRRDWQVVKSRALWLFLWGALAFGIFNLLLYAAFQEGAKAINVAIIHSLIPMLTVMGAVIFLGEKMNALRYLGIAIAFFGVIWLLTKGQPLHILQWRPQKADSYILLSALIYAAYSLELRRAPNVHWTTIMWAMSLAALIIATPFFISDFLNNHQLLQIHAPSQNEVIKAVILVVYVTIFVAILAKMFYMEGVIALGASRGVMVMNLLPICNAIMPLIIFADERHIFGMVHIIALGFVILGIVIAEIGARLQKRAS